MCVWICGCDFFEGWAFIIAEKRVVWGYGCFLVVEAVVVVYVIVMGIVGYVFGNVDWFENVFYFGVFCLGLVVWKLCDGYVGEDGGNGDDNHQFDDGEVLVCFWFGDG